MNHNSIKKVIDGKIVPLAKEQWRYGEKFLAVKLTTVKEFGIKEDEMYYALIELAKRNISVTGLDEKIFECSDNHKFVSEYNMYVKEYSDKEMVLLLEEYSKTRSEVLRDKIVEKAIPLVNWWVWPIAYRVTMSFPEVASYGYEALLKIIESFDAAKGSSFVNYAEKAIIYKVWCSICKQKKEDDIFLSLKSSDIIEEYFQLEDIIAKYDLIEKINIIKSQFTERERIVLDEWMQGKSIPEIASEFKITRQGMYQIFIKTIEKIRLNSDLIKDYY